MSTLYQPSPILQFQRLFVRLSTLEYGRSQRALLSLPSPPRSTPITTTAGVALTIQLGVEGAMIMQLNMWRGISGTRRHAPNAQRSTERTSVHAPHIL